MSRLLFFLFLVSFSVFAQDAKSAYKIDFFADILGKKGVLFIVGIIFFAYTYRNSIKLFAWIEDQTFGMRNYILSKCELLHLEVNPKHVTYLLLFLSFGLSTIVFGIFAFWGKLVLGIFIALILSFLGWKIPKPIVDNMVERRIKRYQSQMVDGLNLLSNGLRAGLSVPQSLGLVVDELPVPISQEFNTILQQTKIGVPLEEAFDNLVKRMPTEDNEMFVSSVNILRETGGNLAEVFDTITEVIRERVRLQQKIDVYIAQGKAQGITIFCMPFAMGGMFAVSEPESMAAMFAHPIGIAMLITAVVLDLIGAWLIFKITKIEV